MTELDKDMAERRVFGPHLPGCIRAECVCREIVKGEHTPFYPDNFSPHATHCEEP